MLLHPRHAEHPALHHDHDGGFAGGLDGLDQLFLHAWRSQFGTVEALADRREFDDPGISFTCPATVGVARVPDHDDGDVAPFGSVDGLRKAVGFRLDQVAASGIADFDARAFDQLANSAQHGDACGVIFGCRVVAILHLVGVRADDSHGLHLRGIEREQMALVLQQNNRLFGHAAGQGDVFGRVHETGQFLRLREDAFPIEKPQQKLDPQNPRAGRVHFGLGDLALFHQLDEVRIAVAAVGFEIYAGPDASIPASAGVAATWCSCSSRRMPAQSQYT